MQPSANGTPQLPPGPKGGRFHNLRARFFGCEDFLLQLNEEYGEVVSWQIPGVECCAVFDVDLIQEILTDQRPYFPRILQLTNQCPTIPNAGLARVNDDAHQRKLEPVNAVFARDRLDPYAEIMIARFRGLRDSWSPGQVVQVKEAVYRVTASILADASVGMDMNLDQALVQRALRDVKWDYGLDYLPLKGLLRKLPLPQNLSLWRSFKALHAIVYESMRRAREPSSQRTDWVAHMVHDADNNPVDPPFTDEEIRDEVIDLLLGGGVDTVALSLTWCLSFLSRNPAVSERLEQEVDEVAGERSLTAADYDRLPYARAVYHEALRLGPPPFFIEREATEDRILGGKYLIPKGTIVQLCRGVVYRKTDYFDHAREFRPERWLNGPPAGCPAHAFTPFSVEPRRCPGWEFSTMTGVFLVASIAQRLRLEAASSDPIESDFKLLYAPKGSVPVLVKERPSAA